MSDATLETDIPARLHRLPWTAFHWLLITALSVTWILDGWRAKLLLHSSRLIPYVQL